MSLASDWVAVWIENGIVYAGVKRIYDYDKNTGYVIEKFGYYHEQDKHKDNANLLALEVSQQTGLPLKLNWRD